MPANDDRLLPHRQHQEAAPECSNRQLWHLLLVLPDEDAARHRQQPQVGKARIEKLPQDVAIGASKNLDSCVPSIRHLSQVRTIRVDHVPALPVVVVFAICLADHSSRDIRREALLLCDADPCVDGLRGATSPLRAPFRRHPVAARVQDGRGGVRGGRRSPHALVDHEPGAQHAEGYNLQPQKEGPRSRVLGTRLLVARSGRAVHEAHRTSGGPGGGQSGSEAWRGSSRRLRVCLRGAAGERQR
mmetsp:Transcript_169216/g.544050  ORF Transcript_169216/g.544050 Transcript_169216/m.544050 type:complete len:244 (+) Transcript_169216:101-832(+)